MDTPQTLVTLPHVEAVIEVTRTAIALDGIAAIVGPNGTGKTEALKQMVVRAASGEFGGSAKYILFGPGKGPVRAIRDILVEFGVTRAMHQRTLQLEVACKLCAQACSDSQLRLLCLDEVDLLAPESLRGLVSLHEYLKSKDLPVAMILAGASHRSKWLDTLPAAVSRTVNIVATDNLGRELTCAVFAKWGAPMATLAEKVRQGDKEATATLRTIWKHCGNGNLRRLNMLARLAVQNHVESLDADTLEKLFAKLMEQP